ncbi:MAG: TerB family tellurite resistance protein [Pseudomonadota bacterium]
MKTLTFLVALVIIVAISFACFFALREYRRYRRIAKTLPDPQLIQQTAPSEIDARRDQLADDLLKERAALPEAEADATREALWTAMLLEAAADGSIDDRELAFVADLFGRMTGIALEAEPVSEAAQRISKDRKAALVTISQARNTSAASKEQILAGAFLVSVADHTLAEREADCLGDIADALAVTPRDRQTILEGITKRLGI